MKRIQLTFDLNRCKSRMPSIVPAYSSSTVYNFDLSQLYTIDKHDNYGLFPVDIDLKKVTNSDISGFEDIPMLEDYGSQFIVSYNTLASWFHFIESYKKFLIVEFDNCSKVCSSLEEVNLYVSPNSYDTSLDDKFEYIGGDTMYNFLCTYIFPRFVLPKKIDGNLDYDYSYYDAEYLMVSDAYKIMEWLEKNKNTEECCDLKKFGKLGGTDMLALLKDWYNNVFKKINIERFLPTDEGEINPNYQTYFQIPILMTNNIDDLGQMSIFADEWSEFLDYSNTSASSGSVCIYDYKDWKHIDSGNTGYIWNNKYKESYFGTYSALTEDEQEWCDEYDESLKERKDWERYFDYYVTNNVGNFQIASGSTFAYKDTELIIDPTPKKMATVLPLTQNYCFVEDGTLYSSTTIDYIIYNTNSTSEHKLVGKEYKVEYDDYSNPYVEINGITYFAFYNDTTNQYEFNFDDNSCKIVSAEEIKSNLAIYYKDKWYVVDKDNLTITLSRKNKRHLVSYYAIDDDGNYYVVHDEALRGAEWQNYSYYTNDGTLTDDSTEASYILFDAEDSAICNEYGTNYTSSEEESLTNESYGYIVDMDEMELYLLNPYKVYNSSKVTGRTESKLDDLVDKVRAIDDVGNYLEGSFTYEEGELYAQPYEGEWLDLMYHVGNLGQHSTLLDVQYDENDSTKEVSRKIWGDILYGIKIYNKTIEGEEFASVTKTMDESGGDVRNIVITELVDILEDYTNTKLLTEYASLDNTIYITFTYYMGAILSALTESNDVFRVIGGTNSDIRNYNKGVKYVEECSLEPSVAKYYMTQDDYYLINYYKVVRDSETKYNDDFGVDFDVNMAYFESEISALCPTDENNNIDTDIKGEYYTYDSNFNALPVTKQEFNVGISSLENIENNIYIQRGIHVAMDRQMKLLEIKTLDALEKYGNGSFNLTSM